MTDGPLKLINLNLRKYYQAASKFELEKYSNKDSF